MALPLLCPGFFEEMRLVAAKIVPFRGKSGGEESL